MIFTKTILAVKSVEKSADFYNKVLDMPVVEMLENTAFIGENLILQSMESWYNMKFLHKEDTRILGLTQELYFEDDDILKRVECLKKYNVKYIHPLTEHYFGQLCVRFFDPDLHIVEIAESLKIVINRFILYGMNIDQLSEKMRLPKSYVIKCIDGAK